MSVEILLLFAAMMAVTYLTRRALLRMKADALSPRVRSGLQFIPVGIFAALIFTSLFQKDGQVVFDWLALSACALCLLLMRVTKNFFLSFGVSLGLVVVMHVV